MFFGGMDLFLALLIFDRGKEKPLKTSRFQGFSVFFEIVNFLSLGVFGVPFILCNIVEYRLYYCNQNLCY